MVRVCGRHVCQESLSTGLQVVCVSRSGACTHAYAPCARVIQAQMCCVDARIDVQAGGSVHAHASVCTENIRVSVKYGGLVLCHFHTEPVRVVV